MRRSPLRRAVSALAAMLVASLVLVGCVVSPQTAPGGVVRVGMPEPTLRIAPENSGDPIVSRILPAITAGLVMVHADGTTELDLAESVTTSNNRDFEVTLRPDATFADGSPVTAASFVDAWRDLAMYASGSPHRSAFNFFKGYVFDVDADKDSEDPQGDIVAGGGLEVIDDTHFVIRLKSARPEFPAELGRAAYLPRAPQDAAAEHAFDAVAALGAGPYRVVGSVPGDRLELEPNPGYVGPRTPKNSGVSIRWFGTEAAALAELVAGEIDVVDRIPSGELEHWTELVGERVVTQPVPVMYSLVLPELSRFRGEEGRLRVSALALAIDRTRIAEEVLGGDALAVTDFLPSTVPAVSVPVPWMERANDINSRRKWEQADEFGVWEPVLTIAVVDGTLEEKIAELVADRFVAALGVETVVLRFSSQDSLEETVETDELAVFRIKRTVAAAPAVADTLQRLLGGAMPGSVRDRLDEAAAEKDPVEAARRAAGAQQPLALEPPLLPLAQPTVSAAYAKGLRDVQFDWAGALNFAALAAPGVDTHPPTPPVSESPSASPSATPSASSGS